MAAFVKNVITEQGYDLLRLTFFGGKIRLTKIVMGDGFLTDGTEIREMTDMVSPAVVLPISDIEKYRGSVVVTGIFHPEQTEIEFYYREIGLYADNPETGEEILFAYGNCGTDAELIYPSGSSTLVEKTIQLAIITGRTETIEAYIPSDACAGKADYEYYLRQVLVFIERAEQAIADADAAVEKAEKVTDTVLELVPTINDTKAKVELLYDAIYGELTDNPFTVTFGTLDAVDVVSGVWNADRQRLEC